MLIAKHQECYIIFLFDPLFDFLVFFSTIRGGKHYPAQKKTTMRDQNKSCATHLSEKTA